MHAKLPRMKLFFHAAAVACLLALPLGARAAEPAAQEHAGMDDDHDNSPLHQAMEKMQKAYRPLSRALRNPVPADKATYLEQLQTIEQLAIEAKTYTPPSIEELPEAERPAKLAAYRSDLAQAIGTMLELERAILADDWDNVKTLGQKLGSERGQGHKKYNPEKPKPQAQEQEQK
jgi:hypothetical protein